MFTLKLCNSKNYFLNYKKPTAVHFVLHCDRLVHGVLPMKLNTVGTVAPGVAAILMQEMLT